MRTTVTSILVVLLIAVAAGFVLIGMADYLLVGAIGGLLGTCELLSRYRDEPVKAVMNLPAFSYILVNVSASMIALYFVIVFDVDFGLELNESTKRDTLRIMLAGLAAMAFFRTSLFTARVADQDVPLGPGYVLQTLLNVTDRAVDRGRAKPRAVEIAELMEGVDFEKAKAALPPLCFGLMQNVSSDEQIALGDQVNLIPTPADGESSHLQSVLLGLLLLGLVGKDVLQAAIEALKDELEAGDAPAGAPQGAPQGGGNDGAGDASDDAAGDEPPADDQGP